MSPLFSTVIFPEVFKVPFRSFCASIPAPLLPILIFPAVSFVITEPSAPYNPVLSTPLTVIIPLFSIVPVSPAIPVDLFPSSFIVPSFISFISAALEVIVFLWPIATWFADVPSIFLPEATFILEDSLSILLYLSVTVSKFTSSSTRIFPPVIFKIL